MTLTASLLYQKTKQSDLNQVKNLNIWGANLEDISILRQCTSVETLSLSVNNIVGLQDLADLKRLRELYLRKNQISDLRQVQFLSRLPNLQVLWLSDNPIDQDPQYRLYVINAIQSLQRLDEKDITPEERQLASRTRFNTPQTLPEDPNAPQVQQPQQMQPTQVPMPPSAGRQRDEPKNPYPSNVQPYNPPAQQAYQQPTAQPQPVYQQPQPVYQQPAQMVPVAVKPVQMAGPSSEQNRKIMLAVLNLVDGLDYESLETIKRQVVALQAAAK